ncbi:hypothetical protein GW17_00033427 [Ensete ventricosum]|nr:hypothetical protein GW17_00033427 [Ensete ventricosum]
MKALVVSIWGLCATEGVVRLQVPENRIGASPATRWRRLCMRVAVCLSIDQGELLGGHSGVEAGGRKGRGSDDESSGAQLPKSKASVRKEVDSEERHSAAEADLPIVNEGMKMQGNGYILPMHGMDCAPEILDLILSQFGKQAQSSASSPHGNSPGMKHAGIVEMGSLTCGSSRGGREP